MDGDTPFSTTANVAGLLTFIVAIAAAVYARVTYLRNSDDEYTRVKQSLAWFKTESAWLSELVASQAHQPKMRREDQMFAFVMDDVLNLERRLLDVISDIEIRAARGVNRKGVRPSVAVEWLGARTKALELVRQREALTARVQFLHMSMMTSRLSALEERLKRTDSMGDSTRVNSFEERYAPP